MENTLTQITNYLATQSWQIAILAAVIAGVSMLLKNKSAHVRYLLWLIVLAKCLTPPLLTIPLAVLPEQQIPQPAAVVPAEIPPLAIEPVRPVIYERPAALAPVQPVIEQPSIVQKLSGFAARQWLPLTWIGGFALFFLVTLIKTLRTNFWLRRARRPLPAGLQESIDKLFSELGIRRPPKLWLVADIGQPFVWGLLRGGIYLPADFAKLDSAKHRRGILGHELSHVLRFDAAVNLLQIIVQAVFWFHPFVWWANKKIRAEREKCCDEMAIARLNAEAKDYSTAIVNTLIAEHRCAKAIPSLAVAGPVKNIEDRIKTILRPDKKFYKRPSFIVVITILLLALIAVSTTLALTSRPPKKTKVHPEEQQEEFITELPNDVTVEDSRNLLMERRDILQKTLQNVEQKYNNGRANSRQLREAKIDLLRIESELAETPQKRIDILEQIVTLYLEQEKTTKLLLDAGRVTQVELNKVKLLRLEAENEFARAKAEGNEQQTDFKAILPNEVTVELVGVCEHPSEGKRWWRPDGSILEEAPYESRDGKPIANRNEEINCLVEFAVRLTGEELLDTGLLYEVPGATRTSGSGGVRSSGPESVKSIACEISKFIKAAEVHLGVASGRWETIATQRVGFERDTIEQTDSGFITWGVAGEEKGEATVIVTDNMAAYDCRVVAEDKAGNVIKPHGSSGGGADDLRTTKYTFGARKEQLVKFQFQARPYEWVEFKNVSLKPGVITDVQVEVLGGEGESLWVYEVNRRVSDFPEAEDFGTPEAAYAAINRVSASGEASGWERVSVKRLAERLAGEKDRGKMEVGPEWAEVLLNARILEVRIWKGKYAMVLAELPQEYSSEKIREPIDLRSLELEEGRWLNAGNDRAWTVQEGQAIFVEACEYRKREAEKELVSKRIEEAIKRQEEIVEAAKELFEKIRSADYDYFLRSKKPVWSEFPIGGYYMTHTRWDKLVEWICKTFKDNPIVSVELGEVFVGDKQIKGKTGWPTVPYKLTLRDGGVLEGDLAFEYNFDGGAGHWHGMEGIDWHLQDEPIKKPAVEGKPGERVETKGGVKSAKQTKGPSKRRLTNEAIYRQLEEIFDLSKLTPEMHLADALGVMKNSVEPPLNVFVFWNDLHEETEVERTSPIKLDSDAKVPLKMALNLLLDSVSGGFGDLTYTVADGLIYIGPKQSLRKKVKTSTHNISDVIGAPATATIP